MPPGQYNYANSGADPGFQKGGVDGRPYLLRGGRENANFCAKSGGRRRNVA